MRKTYRIEIWWEGLQKWSTLLSWYGMPKGKTDGVLMAADALYGGKKIRAVCEQSNEVYQEVGGRSTPTTNSDTEHILSDAQIQYAEEKAESAWRHNKVGSEGRKGQFLSSLRSYLTQGGTKIDVCHTCLGTGLNE